MSAHEETIREQIEHCDRTGRNAAFAALDALVAERDQLRDAIAAHKHEWETTGESMGDADKRLWAALAAAATPGDEQ